MRHMLDVTDWSVEDLAWLMDKADDIIAHPDDYAHTMDRKKISFPFL